MNIKFNKKRIDGDNYFSVTYITGAFLLFIYLCIFYLFIITFFCNFFINNFFQNISLCIRVKEYKKHFSF